MSTGLIPTIVCMVLCIFFPDTYILYACSLASMLYVLYRLAKPPAFWPNLVLLHATLALVLCSVVKLVSGNTLIPDRTLPIILEIIFLSLSFLFLVEPVVYNKIFPRLSRKASVLNSWATQTIAFFCGLHLLALCAAYLFFSPLSHPVLCLLFHILPPLVYIFSMVVNCIFVKAVTATYLKMPFLRIAPICNGKIYVLPRHTQGEEPGKLDIPMEDYICIRKADADQYAREIEKKHCHHIDGDTEPRFSLKHTINSPLGTPRTILLYILPLDDENLIHFCGGKFVSPEEIEADEQSYSSFLKEEIEHLSVVARIWKEFK